jgi:PAS domain S-box-containing protein
MKTDSLLKAISKSAAVLFKERSFTRAVDITLRNLGKATGVSRVYLFRNYNDKRGNLCASQSHEWAAPGISSQLHNPDMQGLRASRFWDIKEHLQKKPFFANVKDLSRSLRKLLEPQHIRSLLLVPVYTGGEWYGFMGFDECTVERNWTKQEIMALQVAANILGGSIENRRREENYRSILEDAVDSLHVGIVIVDSDFKVVWINRAMERFFGLKSRTLMGRDMRSVIREVFSKVLENTAEFRRKVSGSYRDQTYLNNVRCEVSRVGHRKRRVLHYTSAPITQGELSGGRIEQYVDNTAIVQALNALRGSERRYRELVDNMHAGLAYVDERGVIRYVNDSCCSILGYNKRDMIGKEIYDFVAPADARLLKKQFKQRSRGVSTRCGFDALSRSKWVVPVEISATPVFDDAGNFRGNYLVLTDIAEKQKAERLREALLRDASHELKAPTANISMGLNLIKDNWGVPESEDALLGVRMIEHEVERIQRNIDALIDLSAFEAGCVAFFRRKFDLTELLKKVIADMQPRAGEKGLSLRLSAGRGRNWFRGDRDKIYHVFSSLLDNSIKFSSSGTVSVSLRRGKEAVVVCVADQGRGIEPDYLGDMFERHYQRYSSDAGTGIGLTLCRKIVELHGGTIHAESEGGGMGMRVTVKLPLRYTGVPG